MNPLREVFEHMAASARAQAVFGAGFVLALFGGVGLIARPDPNAAYLLFTGLTAAAALVASGLGTAAWISAARERRDTSRRTRLGGWWVLTSTIALILALMLG